MYTIHCGDCRDIMATFAAGSIDSIVCDPPYGLGFMGKGWDHGVPGVEFWQAALRVSKPGAHLLAFGGTRTHHRLMCAIEDAGWEIRDTVMWIYGSGFPKSLDVSKAIDKAAGAEREVVGSVAGMGKQSPEWNGTAQGRKENSFKPNYDETAPSTDAAKQWDGWGTALKPAWEPVILARKPLDGTVAHNVLTHGVGGLNVDGCRVGTEAITQHGRNDSENDCMSGRNYAEESGREWQGRWPANLIHDGSDEVLWLFPDTGKSSGGKGARSQATALNGKVYGDYGGDRLGQNAGGLGDSGSAARFFYCAKVSKRDRNEGLEGLPDSVTLVGAAGHKMNPTTGKTVAGLPRKNHHPTVKPTALMRYLIRLVTPIGGIVLDPFMGSGSTGKAAMLEGMRFVGIDLDDEYCKIAEHRIAASARPASSAFARK